MKKQITRLSPHQNGKVVGVFAAVSSLIFVVPMSLIMFLVVPDVDLHGNAIFFPKFLVLLFPIFYLVFGYIGTVIGCAIYNGLYKLIGGFEFDVDDMRA